MDLHFGNGLDIAVRPIRPDDKDLLVAGLACLSPESRYRRFLTPKPRFTRSELRYLTEVDGNDHVALVALDDRRPGHIVGVGRFVRDRERPDTAEFAIVVGDAYQGRGVGSALARLLVEEARLRGVRRFTATTQSENAAAQRLIASMGRDLVFVAAGDGTHEVAADLAA